ncbi:hypothetical protein GCM10010313_76810 [Streptomyces violarus]|nr:hypothetical protein GCM10010313_76810 [Streptomyces violarus]
MTGLLRKRRGRVPGKDPYVVIPQRYARPKPPDADAMSEQSRLAAGMRAAKGGTGGRSGTPLRRAAKPPAPSPHAAHHQAPSPTMRPHPPRSILKTKDKDPDGRPHHPAAAVPPYAHPRRTR